MLQAAGCILPSALRTGQPVRQTLRIVVPPPIHGLVAGEGGCKINDSPLIRAVLGW